MISSGDSDAWFEGKRRQLWLDLRGSNRCPVLMVAVVPAGGAASSPGQGNTCELCCDVQKLDYILHASRWLFCHPPFPPEVFRAEWRNSLSCNRKKKKQNKDSGSSSPDTALKNEPNQRVSQCVSVCLSLRQKLLLVFKLPRAKGQLFVSSTASSS